MVKQRHQHSVGRTSEPFATLPLEYAEFHRQIQDGENKLASTIQSAESTHLQKQLNVSPTVLLLPSREKLIYYARIHYRL